MPGDPLFSEAVLDEGRRLAEGTFTARALVESVQRQNVGGQIRETYTPRLHDQPCRISPFGRTAGERMRAGQLGDAKLWTVVFRAGTRFFLDDRVTVSGTVDGLTFSRVLYVVDAGGASSAEIERRIVGEERRAR